ncbi:MAG: lysophospholipase [Gammaproteobacteria bacterium]|nr:lysophospholipase [Gammaproteobacteria bacterium]
MVISLVFAVIGAWVFLALILYFFQPYFIYFPHRQLTATPEQAGLEFEPVEFRTSDDVRLDGWYVRAKEPRAVVLFFHGNAGNISHRIEHLAIFNHLKLATFIFDYRGYGLSEGSPSEKGTYRDAEAAWRYLTQERAIPQQHIIVFGESLGAAIATWLATEHRPGALILESAFTSIADLARRYYPYLPAPLLTRVRYPTLSRIPQVSCPLLIIHSTGDEIVPYQHAERLLAAAHEPKFLLKLHGSHNEGFLISGKDYVAGLDQFLSQYFAN